MNQLRFADKSGGHAGKRQKINQFTQTGKKQPQVKPDVTIDNPNAEETE